MAYRLGVAVSIPVRCVSSPSTLLAITPLAAQPQVMLSVGTTLFATWLTTDGLLSPVLEKKGILGPTSGRRPGDVSIPIWSPSTR